MTAEARANTQKLLADLVNYGCISGKRAIAAVEFALEIAYLDGACNALRRATEVPSNISILRPQA